MDVASSRFLSERHLTFFTGFFADVCGFFKPHAVLVYVVLILLFISALWGIQFRDLWDLWNSNMCVVAHDIWSHIGLQLI